MNRLLNAAAVKITAAVGTVWCAIIFGAITIVSLPAVIAQHDVVTLIQWLGSVFLQLVLLPLIMVGGNLTSARTEALILETHAAVLEELTEVRAIYATVVPVIVTNQ